MLNEGTDVYGMIRDRVLAEKTMFDDLTVIYLAAVSTTQIAVQNLVKYLHMDQCVDSKNKLVKEVDSLFNFDVWDTDGNNVN